ncbi:MAG: PIN domain-containing protein [Rhodopirellula sp.]|nr:PIN domain-containing protein [Rhodopirellula sp.]
MIFVDTSAFLARYIENDQFHDAATAYWDTLASGSTPCVTSNFVIDETITLLARRTTGRFATERARQIYASAALQVLRPDEADETAAVVILERYADHEFSFTDCLSFVLMRRHRISEAFTFDAHFSVAGFSVRP